MPGTHPALPVGVGRMAHFGTNKLDKGDPFPDIEMSLTDDASITVPDRFIDAWLVFIIYRGNW